MRSPFAILAWLSRSGTVLLAERRRHGLELLTQTGAQLAHRGQEIRIRDPRADERPAERLELGGADPLPFFGRQAAARRPFQAVQVEPGLLLHPAVDEADELESLIHCLAGGVGAHPPPPRPSSARLYSSV